MYDEFRKERKNSSPETFEVVSNSDRLAEVFNEKGPVKVLKELLSVDVGVRD